MGNLNKFAVRSIVAFLAIGIGQSRTTNLLPLRFSRFFTLVPISLVALIISLFVLPQITCAVDVTLVWDANSEPDLDGYKIFCRQEGDSYSYNHPDWVGSYTETTCTIYGLDDNTAHYFVARAVDAEDNESGDSNEVRYQPGLPPTADAGLNQTVDAGDTVTLDGSNSFDPDDGISTYLWTQTKGTPVTLSDPCAVQPTFIAPSVGTSSEQLLNFELAVTDGEGLCDTDSVIITVYPSSSDSVQTIFDLRCVSRSRNIRLRWSSVPEATCYNVYRSLTSAGPYSMIADCHGSCTHHGCNYRDTNVVKGTEYYYVVTSVAEGVESLYSNESRSN